MGESDFLRGETTQQGIQTSIGLIQQTVDLQPGNEVEIAVRADDIGFIPDVVGNAAIQQRFFQGAYYLYRLKLDTGQVMHALKSHTERLETGTRVKVYLSAGHDLAVFREGCAIRSL